MKVTIKKSVLFQAVAKMIKQQMGNIPSSPVQSTGGTTSTVPVRGQSKYLKGYALSKGLNPDETQNITNQIKANPSKRTISTLASQNPKLNDDVTKNMIYSRAAMDGYPVGQVMRGQNV